MMEGVPISIEKEEKGLKVDKGEVVFVRGKEARRGKAKGEKTVPSNRWRMTLANTASYPN